MNSLLFSCFFLVAVALVSGYNFEDPFYNEILARDLDDYSSDSSITIHRSRRDEEAQKEDKCRRRHFRGCCADQTFDDIHDRDRSIKRECFKQVFGKEKDAKYFHRDPFKCENVDKHRRDITCVMQCVLQKKNLVDSDGQIKEDEFRGQLKDVLKKETWITPMLDKIATKCLEEARNASATPVATAEKGGSSPGPESTPCNPAGIKLGRCLYTEIQMSCPADQIKDEKACARIRERIKRNEDFFPPHPQPQMDDDN